MLVATGAAALAGLAVVLAGARVSGHPARSIDEQIVGRDERPRRPGRAAHLAITLAERSGRVARSTIGRRPDPAADRRAGFLLIVALSAVVFDAFVVLLLAGATVVVARFRRLRRHRRSDDEGAVERDLPELVDLLGLSVAAGHTFHAAVPVVTRWAPPSLAPALYELDRELGAGRPATEAIEGLGEQWGPAARPLVLTLRSHLRDGTPLADALERVGEDARLRRQRGAENRSRRLPVLMLFPLVLCTLPAFGVLTVAPIVAGTLRSLTGEQLEAAASSPLQKETLLCTPQPPIYSPASSPVSPASCPGLEPPGFDGRSQPSPGPL